MEIREKLIKIEEILGWYGETMKDDNGCYCSVYEAFQMLVDMWNEIKPSEKLYIIDTLFD